MFEVGDVVRLKSGGGTMTVENSMGGRTACIWFVDSFLNRGTFVTDQLELANVV